METTCVWVENLLGVETVPSLSTPASGSCFHRGPCHPRSPQNHPAIAMGAGLVMANILLTRGKPCRPTPQTWREMMVLTKAKRRLDKSQINSSSGFVPFCCCPLESSHFCIHAGSSLGLSQSPCLVHLGRGFAQSKLLLPRQQR